MDPAPARTIAVVDDHRTFVDLFALALAGRSDFTLVGQAGTAAQALPMLRRSRPDIVLMDVELPDGDGIALTERVRAELPDTRVAVLTSHNTLSLASRAVAAGAAAFVTKDGPLSELFRVLTQLGDGLVTVSARSAPHRPGTVELTARELEVLELMAHGCDVAAIATRLGITRHTCRGYVKSLYAKLGVHSQLEALVAGLHQGLVKLGRPAR